MRQQNSDYFTKFPHPFAHFLYHHVDADETHIKNGDWMGLYGKHVLVESDHGEVSWYKLKKLFPGDNRPQADLFAEMTEWE